MLWQIHGENQRVAIPMRDVVFYWLGSSQMATSPCDRHSRSKSAQPLDPAPV